MICWPLGLLVYAQRRKLYWHFFQQFIGCSRNRGIAYKTWNSGVFDAMIENPCFLAVYVKCCFPPEEQLQQLHNNMMLMFAFGRQAVAVNFGNLGFQVLPNLAPCFCCKAEILDIFLFKRSKLVMMMVTKVTLGVWNYIYFMQFSLVFALESPEFSPPENLGDLTSIQILYGILGSGSP